MKNVKHLYLFVCYLAIPFLLVCCQNDDLPDVNSQPEFNNLVQNISSLPGQTFTMQATISDPSGIKSISLIYEPWFLNKTIRKDSLPENYELNYSFRVPDDAIENTTHTIVVVAENVGGITTEEEIVVTLNADIESPEILVNSPADGATVLIGDEDEIFFDINLTDNQELSELVIESDIFTETVMLSGGNSTYTNSINIDTPGLYTFNFTVTDAAGNTSTASSSVNVVDELSFINMYLVDTSSQSDFNAALSGYPYVTTPSTLPDEEGFVFTVRYYAEADNTEVRFVAQNTGFGPYTFGANPSNEGELIIGSDNTVSPIVLPAVGYYDITMSLIDLSYSVTPITGIGSPDIAGFTGVYATGTGLSINGQAINAYNPAASAPLTVDPNNPFRYSATIVFNEANGSFILVGNQENWGVFWRMNNGAIESTTAIVPQGGVECGFATQYSGNYLLTVDIYLNTFRISQL